MLWKNYTPISNFSNSFFIDGNVKCFVKLHADLRVAVAYICHCPINTDDRRRRSQPPPPTPPHPGQTAEHAPHWLAASVGLAPSSPAEWWQQTDKYHLRASHVCHLHVCSGSGGNSLLLSLSLDLKVASGLTFFFLLQVWVERIAEDSSKQVCTEEVFFGQSWRRRKLCVKCVEFVLAQDGPEGLLSDRPLSLCQSAAVRTHHMLTLIHLFYIKLDFFYSVIIVDNQQLYFHF